MALDVSKVYAPTPDQSLTTGALACAATGTAEITDARTALSSDWDDSGYITEDGVSIAVTRSTTAIKDWSKATVRKVLSEYEGNISLAFLGVDQFAAEAMFGEDNVTVTDATSSAGNIINVAIGNELPPVKAYCASMKDEDRRVRIYIPYGQFTDVNQIDFKPDTGLSLGGTMATYDDGTGHSIYVIFDDGEIVSA